MAQERRLARAVAAHERDALPGRDGEVDPAQQRGAAAQLVPHAVEPQGRVAPGAAPLGPRRRRRVGLRLGLRQQPARRQGPARVLHADGQRPQSRLREERGRGRRELGGVTDGPVLEPAAAPRRRRRRRRAARRRGRRRRGSARGGARPARPRSPTPRSGAAGARSARPRRPGRAARSARRAGAAAGGGPAPRRARRAAARRPTGRRCGGRAGARCRARARPPPPRARRRPRRRRGPRAGTRSPRGPSP